MSSIRYLARSGQAIRGHTEDSSNILSMLLAERALDVPILAQWIAKRDNWLSSDIQNEIIQMLAHNLQRSLISDIKTSEFVGLIADGTTDVSGHEQFTICLRTADITHGSVDIRETYIGMFDAPDSKSKTYMSIINDVFIRLGLDISQLRGHCFDGASNMTGHIKGVKTLIQDTNDKSMFVHCANHSLDLALQDVAKNTEMMCNALTTVREVSNVILESAKRKHVYNNVVLKPTPQEEEGNICNQPKQLLSLRWSVRVRSLKRFEENYSRVLETLGEIIAEKGAISMERRPVITGYKNKLEKSETLFAISAAISVFAP